MIYVLDTKTCSKCNKTKSLSMFPKTRNWCLECKSEQNKVYQKQLHLRKKQDPDYVKKKQINTRKWRNENRKKSRESNRNWKINNPEKAKLSDFVNSSRRRVYAGVGQASSQQIENRLKYYGYLCVYCKEPYEEIDHFYPLSKGGTNHPANLVPSCKKCNRSKHNKNPWDFINSLNGE